MCRRFGDNPTLVSDAFLKQIDADPPGTWAGSVKLDGFRRMIDNTDGRWTYQAKHTKGPAACKMPDSLVQEFEALPWPKHICLDAEYLGRRCVDSLKGQHSLHVFDVLMYRGEWMGQTGFSKRHELLTSIFVELGKNLSQANVKLVTVRRNPGLSAFFDEQKTNPLSEGLVVRHRDSKLVGNFNACASGDRMYKCKYR